MTRSLYDVLGVPLDANAEEIKKAYRRLAKTMHPDLTNESRDRFQKLQAAYEVLSNADKRRDYDRTRELGAVSWTGGWSRPYPVRQRSGAQTSPYDWFDMGGRDDGNEKNDKHDRNDGDHMDLMLSSDEARRGGDFGVELPITGACGCIRWGGLAGCFDCRGTGVRRRLESIRFQVPPGVSQGYLLVGRLSDGRELRVRVRLTRR